MSLQVCPPFAIAVAACPQPYNFTTEVCAIDAPREESFDIPDEACRKQAVDNLRRFFRNNRFTPIKTYRKESIFSKEVLSTYQRNRDTHTAPKCRSELRAEKILPHYGVDPSAPTRFALDNTKKIDKRFTQYGKAATYYLNQAEAPHQDKTGSHHLCAKDRAILYNKARNALDKQIDFRRENPQYEAIKLNIMKLRQKEAQACLEASEESKDANEQLNFLKIGILAMQRLPFHGQESPHLHPGQDRQLYLKECETGTKIWKKMADLVSENDFDLREQFDVPGFERMYKRGFLQFSKEYIAAQCLMNAGRVTQSWIEALPVDGRYYIGGITYYSNAEEKLRIANLGVSNERPIQKAIIQEQIFETIYQRLNIRRDINWNSSFPFGVDPETRQIIGEGIKTAEKFGLLASGAVSATKEEVGGYYISQSRYYYYAAIVSDDLQERFNLTEKALVAANRGRDIFPPICDYPAEARKQCNKDYFFGLEKFHKDTQHLLVESKKCGVICTTVRRVTKFVLDVFLGRFQG